MLSSYLLCFFRLPSLPHLPPLSPSLPPSPLLSPELTLDQRVEYMSRGVMCAKSSRLTTTSDTIGELLHELEEKMEVCVIHTVYTVGN